METQADTLGRKFDDEKPRWDLVPWESMEHVVNVLTFGARKYAPDNWRFVPDARNRYFAAAMRHMIAARAGELDDEDTGEPHLAHAVCCLLFAIWFDEQPVGYKPTNSRASSNAVGMAVEDSKPIPGTHLHELKVHVQGVKEPIRPPVGQKPPQVFSVAEAVEAFNAGATSVEFLIPKQGLREVVRRDWVSDDSVINVLDTRVTANLKVDIITSRLKRQIEDLQAQLAKVTRDHDTMFANLGHVQAKCTEQAEEIRRLHKAASPTVNGPTPLPVVAPVDGKVIFTRMGP